MTITTKKDFKIEILLAKLSEERILNADGSISMSGFGTLDKFESYLRTAISARGISDALIRSVVKEAINAEQNLTEKTFLKHCNKIAYRKIRNDRKTFKVVFPVWGNGGLVTGRRKWADVSITFDVSQNSSFARRAKKDRAEQLKELASKTSAATKNLQSVPLAMCSVQAVDAHDAFEKAEAAISKELGLYSLFSARGKFLFNNGPDRPINTLLLAPHMTVHDPTGAMSVNMYWQNRWPDQFAEKGRSPAEIEKTKIAAEKVRKKLRKLPWREDAELALARYCAAFGQCDLEASFLDGWRLLEAIGGHSRENSETLVRRAAWFFEEREEHFQVGLHLMHRRNLISHGRPVRDHDNEGLAFQMKQFLEPFLHAFLTNPFNFKDIHEFRKFCDLPVDRGVREQQAHLLNCSAKFRRENTFTI